MGGQHIFGRQFAAPPIHGLPVELLSEIFVIVAYMARQTVAPTAWMQLLLVCKLWKTIACDIAELWRVVYVNSNQNWLRLCLDRAPGCLIDIHLPNAIRPRDFQAAKLLILPHKDRIRTMRINDALDNLTKGIVDLFTVDLPVLEEISFIPVEWRVEREISFALSAQAFPRIQSLTLSGISIPREPAFYRNIRRLELHENCCQGTGFTVRDLVDALHAASTTLQDLDLSRFDPIQEPQLVERPHFHLRNLRSFCMDNAFQLASQILKHLHIPPNTYLRLRIAVSQSEVVERSSTDYLLAAIIPSNIRVALDQAEELAVLVERERLCVQVFDNIPSRLPPSSIVQGSLRSDRGRIELLGPYVPGEALRVIPKICASTRLTTLSICSSRIQPDPRDWNIVLDGFPLLENFSVQWFKLQENWSTYVGVMFAALMPESANRELSAATSGGIARCPSLKAIHVEGCLTKPLLSIEESRKLLNAVMISLRSREGYARKLETLTLRSFLSKVPYRELARLVDKVEILP